MHNDHNKYSILKDINTPQELRKLSENHLNQLCLELRKFLLISVSKSSGHFASGLGAIELTVALHYVYNTPFDYLIWDVGHQAYPHKILTGRRERIFSIHHRHGLHPFPCRDESEYDVLSVGHSSTSISAGLGLAVAAEREKLGRQTICVIGDGAITAGMAFEAINHAGTISSDLLVILNDNDMSISENVGALNNYCINKKKNTMNFDKKCEKNNNDVCYLKKINQCCYKNIIKNFNISSDLFEKFGFHCIGPIDGHNVLELVYQLRHARSKNGPQFLHIATKKGYGYKPAEQNPIKWHAVPKFNPISGILEHQRQNTHQITYSKIFGDWLCQMAIEDNKLIGITPAMREGSGMTTFSKKYPKQYFDVAIAEQHAVTFAAGLSIAGYKPVVAIYSTFLQRAYDQVIHDVAIPSLPILFAIDRGGIVGFDGQTHQGAFDLSYLRCIPNIVIMTPSDSYECKLMLHTGYHYNQGPSVVRYPKGYAAYNEFDTDSIKSLYSLPISKGIIKRKGKRIAILNFGTLLQSAYHVASKLNATLVDMRFVKPLDKSLIKTLAHNHKALITLEENVIIGGAGSGVNEFIVQNKLLLPVLNIGLPDYFISHGSQSEILSELGLDSSGIYEKIVKWAIF